MKHRLQIAGITAYFLFLAISLITGFAPGKQIAGNFATFSLDMVEVLPCAFILIGLFEIWIKKETVARHLGERSGPLGYFWAILLAGTTVGGIFVAFPMAASLHGKGARLSVVFTYIGASAICRTPMTIFEASFLGIRFTLVRFFVSIPLLILSSILLGNFLEKRNFIVTEERRPTR